MKEKHDSSTDGSTITFYFLNYVMKRSDRTLLIFITYYGFPYINDNYRWQKMS